VQLSGAQALIKSLEQQGVDTIFGLPGGAILPVYDPLIDSSIRHILVRHEQGAVTWPRVRPRYWSSGRRHGHERTGRHEHRHAYW